MKILVLILTVLQSLLAMLSEKTLQSEFELQTYEQNVPYTYTGSIQMRGECFRMQIIDILASYDGKTFYHYSEETEELTLSKPSEEELLSINPFLFAKLMPDVCDITERDVQGGSECEIVLVPKEGGAAAGKITLRVRKSDMLPLSVVVVENRQTYTLRFTKPAWSSELPSWPLSVPGAYVNDLR